MRLHWIRIALFAGVPLAAQEPSIEIRVLEGEGAVYTPGSRATRGITVQINDANGRPVDAASVSFQLPERGPSALFASGGRTEIVTTRADGLASVWGMRWNGSEGPVEIRVTAAKAGARATGKVTVTLSKAADPEPKLSGGGHKWLWISLAIAGAAGGGLAVRGMGGGTQSASPASAVNAPRIGTPTFALGRP